MSKHEIEIEGLPEGWRPVAFRPRNNLSERFLSNDNPPVIMYDSSEMSTASVLIVEKIKPRRIVLEETDEKYLGCQTLYVDGTEIIIMTNKTWKQVKEAELSVTKDDDKLSLSVDEARSLLDLIIESNPPEIVDKLCNFVEANS